MPLKVFSMSKWMFPQYSFYSIIMLVPFYSIIMLVPVMIAQCVK